MLRIFFLIAATSVVLGLPVDQTLNLEHVRETSSVTVVPIVSEDFSNKGDGSKNFGSVSGDGTTVQEEGYDIFIA
ncbi:hypothetical protein WA026_003501 [Henosepilachna vigintioctopunctata]|uniref:RxLR effector protein n=1 Tax=Henosepilachna vigintioctopunctata TaxID=420089 RepID=A0AAW1TN97_9CUCU